MTLCYLTDEKLRRKISNNRQNKNNNRFIYVLTENKFYKTTNQQIDEHDK